MFLQNETFKNVLVLAFVILIHQEIRNVDGDPNEKRLLHHLIDTYNTLERPVVKHTDTLHVNISVTLLRLAQVDEIGNSILTNAWLSMNWIDNNLMWNASEFGDIDIVKIPPHRIWFPDVHIYNQVGFDFDPTHHTMAVVKSDGKVNYIPPGVFHTSCRISLENYPYDEQKCDMKLGSWTHHGHQLMLDIESDDGGDISSFIKNSEWELTGFPVKKNTVYYACCPEPYVDVTFTLHLRRRGDHVMYLAWAMNLGIFTLLFLSALLPPSTGHKINLAVLAVPFCAYTAQQYNPRPIATDDTPRLALYFEKLLVVSFSVLVGNVIMFYLYNRKGSMHSKVKSILIDKILPIFNPVCPIRYKPSSVRLTTTGHGEGFERVGTSSDVQELISQVENLKEVVLERQQEINGIMNDWNYLAIVLDRLLFIFWTLFIVIFASVEFPSF